MFSATRLFNATDATPGTPPTFVGGKIQAFAKTTSDISVSLTGLTGGSNTSPSTGDLVIIVFAVGYNNQTSFGGKAQSGWTVYFDSSGATSTGWANDQFDTSTLFVSKVMGGTPDTSFTITGGTGPGGDAPGIAMVQVWRGAGSIAINGLAHSNTMIPNPVAPLSPVANSKQLVFAAGCGVYAGSSVYSTTFFTDFFASSNRTDSGLIVVCGHGAKDWINGADDPPLFSMTGFDSTNNSYIAYTVIVPPA